MMKRLAGVAAARRGTASLTQEAWSLWCPSLAPVPGDDASQGRTKLLSVPRAHVPPVGAGPPLFPAAVL